MSKDKIKPSRLVHAEVRALLAYDSATGVFTWKRRVRQRKLPRTAGTQNKSGYTAIGIKGVLYKTHHLAWFYVYGKWPTQHLDHINGNKQDNRISNLREANKQQNQANAQRRRDNRTGFKGVSSPLKGRRKFPCTITVNKKGIWLGSFETKEEAHAAYATAAKKYFGEYARP